jgi:DNA modification methylase
LGRTQLGTYYAGDSTEFLRSKLGKDLRGKVQLLLTSPPFPLNNKKSYGNLSGEKYKDWLSGLAKVFADLLTDNGSIVIEMGNAWVSGRPVQSLLHLESLIGFLKNPDTDLRLCQQFICYNPSRLPSPAQWVTIERIRTTDSYTQVWWMAKTDFPKADNRRVLRPYSKEMKELLARKNYNAGKRPSEHLISKRGFMKDHQGSIMPNVFELEPMDENREVRLPNVFSISNTESNDFFMRRCREKGITPHPARMPKRLAAFFIEFLTDPGDLVLDPFAGSNTTGFVAELLQRRWISMEIKEEYALQSLIRFEDPVFKKTTPH